MSILAAWTRIGGGRSFGQKRPDRDEMVPAPDEAEAVRVTEQMMSQRTMTSVLALVWGSKP